MNNRISARLTSRILTDDADRQAFTLSFNSVGRVMGGTFQIPEEYLRRATERGFFKNGEMVAGYIFNTSAPFRIESHIPDEALIALQQLGYLIEATSCELTCMWMRKGRLTKFERNAVYFRSTLDTFRAKKRYVIAGSAVEVLARKQKLTLPRTIYNGPSSKGGTLEIYYATRYTMIIRIAAIAIATYSRDSLRLLRDHALAFFHFRDPTV